MGGKEGGREGGGEGGGKEARRLQAIRCSLFKCISCRVPTPRVVIRPILRS